jgi:uncharacterized protein involved in outer membrane biogenesis
MKNRKLIIIFPLGLILLVCVAIAWWFIGDDAWVKGKIEDFVSEMTGRTLSIEGPFSMDWSSNPVLAAENIHFSNPDWAINPDLARLSGLEVSIDLLSIFADQIRINYIVMNGLVIALEERESGETSWELALPQQEPAPATDAPPAELPISVDRITLAGFTLLHEAPDRTVPLDFHLEQLELTQDPDQRLQFSTDGRFGGEEFDLSGNLGPLNELVAGGETSHDIKMHMGEIALQSKGSIENSSTFSGANVKLTFSGPEFEWILTQLAMPEFSHGDFDFRLDLQTAGEQTRLILDGDLGSLQANARGDLNDLAGTAELTADVSGEDLGGLLEVVGVPGIPRNPFSLKVGVSHARGLFQLQTLVLDTGGNSVSVTGQLGNWPQLADTDLAFSASGPDLLSWGGALHLGILPGVMLPDTDFDLNGRISRAGSQPVSTDTQLRLGDSRIQLSGSLGKLPSLLGADLTLAVNGSADGVLTQALGIEGIPGKDFSLKARLRQDDSITYLDEVRFDLADNHLDLSGQLGGWPEFEGTNLVVSLAGSDLSVWAPALKMEKLPASTFSVKGNINKQGKALAFNDLELMLGDNSLRLNGLMGLNEQFEGSDFQANMILPNLAMIGSVFGVGGLPEQDLSVSGKFQRIKDGWVFRLSDGSFAGAGFESEGKYTDMDGRQQIEATSHLVAPNLAKLARVAGVEGLPQQAIDITGFARYEAGLVEIHDMEGRLGDSQFKVSAKVVNPPTFVGSEVTLSASGQDIGQLLVNRDFERTLPFSLDGSVARENRNIRLSQVKGSLGELQINANGIVGNLDNLSATDLQLSITAPSLQSIGEFLDFPLPDDPFRLRTRFQGSPSVFHAEKLEINLGPSDLSGELSVDLSGKTSVNGVFESNYLDLAWLQKEDKDDSSGEKPNEKSKKGYLIPNTPIVLPQLDLADIDIEVTLNQIDFLYRTSRDVHIHSRVKNGNLYLDPFQTRGEDGGLLSGSLAVEREVNSDITNVELSLEGDDVQLGIGQFEGQDPETFRETDIVANLGGSGATYRELAASLDGHIEVVQGPGLTGNSGLSLIFGNFIGEVLNMLNPFSKSEKFTVNECAVTVVNIESGVVTVDPIASQTEKMTIIAKGVVDLHTEKMQFAFNTKLRKGIGISASMVVNPFVSVTGTLKSPIVGLDPAALAVKGTIAVATVGISLLARSLADRYLSSKDPCGDALKKSRKQSESSAQKGKKKK